MESATILMPPSAKGYSAFCENPIFLKDQNIKKISTLYRCAGIIFTNSTRWMKIVLILTNSADPDDMQLYAVFHLGPQCMPNYPFRDFTGY